MGKNISCGSLCAGPMVDRTAPILPIVTKLRAQMNTRARVRSPSCIDCEESRRYVQACGRNRRKIPEIEKPKLYFLTAARSQEDDVGDGEFAVPYVLYVETQTLQLLNEVALRHAITPLKPSWDRSKR